MEHQPHASMHIVRQLVKCLHLVLLPAHDRVQLYSPSISHLSCPAICLRHVSVQAVECQVVEK